MRNSEESSGEGTDLSMQSRSVHLLVPPQVNTDTTVTDVCTVSAVSAVSSVNI